jgi:hypothetical protein
MDGQAQSMFDTTLGKVDASLASAIALLETISKTPKADRNHIKNKKATVELTQNLGVLRDEMAALLKANIEGCGRLFGQDGNRLSKMKTLLTGGVDFESTATGGIFFLIKDDPDNIGQDSFRTVSNDLKRVVQSAIAATSDGAAVGQTAAASLTRAKTSSGLASETESTDISFTIDGIAFAKLKADAKLTERCKTVVVEEAVSIIGNASKDAVKASVSDQKGVLQVTVSVTHPKNTDTASLTQKISKGGAVLTEKVKKACS